MIDFFDEDFPLTKKQAEREKQRSEAEAEKSSPAQPQEVMPADTGDLPEADNYAAEEAAQPDLTSQEALTEEPIFDEAEQEFVPEAEIAEEETKDIFSFSFPSSETALEETSDMLEKIEAAEDADVADVVDIAGISESEDFADSVDIIDSADTVISESYSEDALDVPAEVTEDTAPAVEAFTESPAEDIADVQEEDNAYTDEAIAEPDINEYTYLPDREALVTESESIISDSEYAPEETAESPSLLPDTEPESVDLNNEAVNDSAVESVCENDYEDVTAEEADEPVAEEIVPADNFQSYELEGDSAADEAVLTDEAAVLEELAAEIAKEQEPDEEDYTAEIDSVPESIEIESSDKPRRTLTPEEISAEIEDAVSSAINLHIETFIRGFKPSDDESDRTLREELSRLNRKLDNVEKAVGAIEVPLADESDSHGFSYEYDERYFAEEETPAYKYPGLYKKVAARDKERSKTAAGSANKAYGKSSAKSQAADKSSGNITVNTKTLFKMGAMVAATAAAVKLLGKKNN